MRYRYTQNATPCLKFAVTLFTICITVTAGRITDARTAETTVGTDIMVVLDLSGSMNIEAGREDDANSNNSRFNAFFSWVTAFSATGDRLGIVAMGNGAKLVAPLTERDKFRFSDYCGKLKRRAKYTDVAAGLENAYYELKNNTRQNATRLIILFSDAQIDMPKGMWDLENSLRYLHNSLVPSMKREHIQMLAIVPDGLQANFQLLQELTSETEGAYFRGLPGDAVAIRQQFASRAKPLQKPDNTLNTPSQKTPLPIAQKSPAANSVMSTGPAKHAPDMHTAPPVSQPADSGVRIEFFILGGILLLGFAIMLSAITVLFKRTAQRKDESPDELVDMLHELQSLKSDADKSESMEEAFNENTDETDESDFGEPEDRLSVSLVSPFLDYQETKGTIRKHRGDEIAIKPAFSDEHTEDINLSVSNMETLIGTGLPEVEDKK